MYDCSPEKALHRGAERKAGLGNQDPCMPAEELDFVLNMTLCRRGSISVF